MVVRGGRSRNPRRMPPTSSRTGPPEMSGVPPLEDILHHFAKRGIVESWIQHAAVLLAQSDSVDAQRLGELGLGQIETIRPTPNGWPAMASISIGLAARPIWKRS